VTSAVGNASLLKTTVDEIGTDLNGVGIPSVEKRAGGSAVRNGLTIWVV
jgi:hypothetical protein